MIFKRPMLAAPLLPATAYCSNEVILCAMQKLKYPVLTTLKKDGIRAIRLSGSLYSRTLKEIPNHSIRHRSITLPGGFDMELWNPSLTYDRVESIVMSREHKDSDLIQFHILDWVYRINPTFGYEHRCALIANEEGRVKFHFQRPILCEQPTDLFTYFLTTEEQGAEGICFRTPNSPYKQGRSTLREQYLVKLCRWLRTEVTITGTYEQMSNENVDSYNAVGMMDRSSNKENQVGKDTLGGFNVVTKEGVTFDVGTGIGLTDKRRRELWGKRGELVGKQITIKHKPHGQKDKPRSPVFCGFREEGY